MHRHEVVLYWSDDDDAFIAEAPELPGCIAHGDTQANALDNINEAISLRLDTAHEFGDPIPEPKRRLTPA